MSDKTYSFYSIDQQPVYENTVGFEQVEKPTKIQNFVLSLAKKVGAIRPRTFKDKVDVEYISERVVSNTFKDLVVSMFKDVYPRKDDWVLLISPEHFMEEMKLENSHVAFSLMDNKMSFRINGIRYQSNLRYSECLGVELFVCPTITEPVLIPKTIAFKVEK